MAETEQEALDKQMRALARLRSLKTLLESPKTDILVPADLASVYDDALRRLSESGENVREFELPTSELFDKNGRGKQNVYRDPLLTRVSSVLEYFAIRAAVLQTAEALREEPSRMIGFEPPKD